VKRHHGSFDDTFINSLNTNKFLKLFWSDFSAVQIQTNIQDDLGYAVSNLDG